MALKAPRGTKDILPDETPWFQMLEETARRVFQRYGYQEIRTPMFESTELFTRSIGEETDIVSKEMYTFPDRKGRSLTLRPEGTAPVVRALIQANLLKRQGEQTLYQVKYGTPAKFYYMGSMFRYERPQAGRQRQFHQTGIEFFGCSSPLADAELIAMLSDYLQALGFKKPTTKLNTLGNMFSRKGYNDDLRNRLAAMKDKLCNDCTRRADVNPLRVLDCKNPNCQALFADFPVLKDFLDEESRTHYETVCAALDDFGVVYEESSNLVRGFDYYTHTVFETCLEGLGSQDAVLGGGRYDGLVEELGGPSTPAVGAAFGMERLVMAMKACGIALPSASAEGIVVVGMTEKCLPAAAKIAQDLRLKGFSTRFDFRAMGMKAALKTATKGNFGRMVLIGDDELEQGIATVKNLENREQEAVALTDVAAKVCGSLSV